MTNLLHSQHGGLVKQAQAAVLAYDPDGCVFDINSSLVTSIEYFWLRNEIGWPRLSFWNLPAHGLYYGLHVWTTL